MDNKPSQSILSPEHIRSRLALVVILLLFVTSGFLLAYLLHDMDWELIHQTEPGIFALILGLTVLGTLIYALLVYLLMRSSGHSTTLWQAYLVLTSSLSANYITPVKVGIPLRIYLYSYFMDIPAAMGTALVTVEALVGMLTPAFIAIAGTVLLFPSLGLTAPVVLVALLLAGLLFILRVKIGRLQSHLERLPFSRFTTRVIRFIERVQSGLRYISPMTVLMVVGLDLLMLWIQALRLWLVLGIFGPAPTPLSLLAVLTISVTAGNLSLIPMGLGVRDASFTLLLAQLGVPHEIALSAAVIQRLFSPGWPLLLGLISTNVLGVSEVIKRPADIPGIIQGETRDDQAT